jgi:restriction system protein
MAKKAQAEFIRWFGPLLDALRDLGDSGRPREASARISKNLGLAEEPRTAAGQLIPATITR